MDEAIPRISLGVGHVKEHLEDLVSELEEPIAIIVAGRRKAVLVPYARYVEMVHDLREAQERAAEEEPEPGEEVT